MDWVATLQYNVWFIFSCKGINDKILSPVTALIISISIHPAWGCLFHSETQQLRPKRYVS